jgi:toxin YoeB
MILRKNLDLSKQRKREPKNRDAVFHPEFREDLEYWIKTERKTALRAFRIIEKVMLNLFQGIGKPEPLRYLPPGTWSRRLSQEHRIVYFVKDKRIIFLQARYHY